MKLFSLIALTLTLAVSAGAQIAMQPTTLPPLVTDPAFSNAIADTNIDLPFPKGPAVAELTASAATLTAPLVLTNNFIILTNDAMADDATNGGKAVFTFTLTNAGDYVIEALAHAVDDNSNSYFVNVDAMPADDMVWDVVVADGFEKHLVSWRGSGDAATPEFAPKVFKLEAGKHQLILTGREPGTELKSIAVCPALKPKT